MGADQADAGMGAADRGGLTVARVDPRSVVTGSPDASVCAPLEPCRAVVDIRVWQPSLTRGLLGIVRAPRIAFVLLASGCGPASVDDAERREICGESAPVRVLAFPDEAGPFAGSAPEIIDADHLLWAVTSYVPGDEVTAYHYGPFSVWITGRCGESPRRIDGIETAWTDAGVPGAIVTTIGDPFPRDIVVIDPDDPARRSMLFDDVGIRVGDSPYGWLSVDDVEAETADLVFRPYPDDPWSGPVPATPIARVRGPFMGPEAIPAMQRIEVRDGEVWVLSADDELVRIAMPAGSMTLEQTGVRAFELSADARWLIWQDDTIVDDGTPERPKGRLWLRDRDGGGDRELWIGSLAPPALEGVEQGGLWSPDGWLRLSDLAPAPIPAWTRPTGGRWILPWLDDPEDFWAEPLGLSLIDLATGAEQVLYDRPAQILYAREDGLEVAHGIDLGSLATPNEAELVLVPFDGSPPHTLARAVTAMYRRLDDGRVVTPLSVDDDRRGALVLVDPETLDEAHIDDDVFVVPGIEEADPALWGEAVVLYSVADGDRSGMWIAGLPERQAHDDG